MEDFSGSKPASSVAHTPASSSVPAGATTVKVSLDEWATVRRNSGAELMTDGLSGCVAVAVRTDDRIALTHVFSDAYDRKQTATGIEDRFDAYKGDLSRFIESVGGRDAIREVHLVHNGNPIAMGRERNLAGLIEDHFVQSNAVHADRIRTHVDNGCTITSDNLYLKGTDNQALYVGGYTNTALAGLQADLAEGIKPHLGHGTFACSRGNPGPADIEMAPRAGGAVEHSPGARYVAPRPEPEFVAPVGPPAELTAAVRAKLDGTGINFGFQKASAAGTIATAAHAADISGDFMLTANADKDKITLTKGDESLEFSVTGRQVKLLPTSVPLAEPSVAPGRSVAESSTPSAAAALIAESSTPRISVSVSSGSPPSLYQQAFDALGPQRETLGIRTEQQAIESARELASHANQSGLTAISRLEVATPDGGKPSLVAYQDDTTPKQTAPMAIETLQQQAGMATRDMSQDSPDKTRAQTL